MGKRRVAVKGGGGRAVAYIDPDATKGSQAGKDLLDSEGSVLADEDVITSLGTAYDVLHIAGVPVENIIDPATGTIYQSAIDFAEDYKGKDLSNVPDDPGGARNAVSAVDPNHRAIIDFSQAAHLGKHLGNIADSAGDSRFAVFGIDANRRAIIDFSQAGHTNKTIDNISDGTTYGRPLLSRLNTGRPLIDFSEAIHSNKNIDNVADGTTRKAVTSIDAAGKALIDFSQAGHTNKTADNIAESATRKWAAQSGADVTSLALPQAAGVFFESFEQGVNNWTPISTVVPSLVSGSGVTGGKLIEAQGGSSWYTTTAKIPFDPSKLYRIRCRVRRTATTDALTQHFFCGVQGVAADGVTLINTGGANSVGGQHYNCASNVDGSAWTLNAWQDFTGWFKGNAGTNTSGASTDPTTPKQLFTGVAYFQPLFIMNYSAGPAGNVMQLDYIAIDVFDAADATQVFYAGNVDVNSLKPAQAGADVTSEVHPDIDALPDGTTYARILGTELSSGAHKLTVAGSGLRLGDQKNLPQSNAAGYGGVQSAVPLSAASGATHSAISINAHTVTLGSTTFSISAVSNAITGLGLNTKYFVGASNPAYGGGTLSYFANTSAYSAANQGNDEYYQPGSITTPPANTSGGSGGGGAQCVHASMWLREGLQAKDAKVGDVIDTNDGPIPIDGIRFAAEPCVRLTAENGFEWVGSLSTPFTLADGSTEFSPQMYGHAVLTEDGWARVASLEFLDALEVAKIEVGGRSYLAGVKSDRRVMSHNNIK